MLAWFNNFVVFGQLDPKLPFGMDEAIFLWGSIYPQDWQHAIIDLLPMLNFAWQFIAQKPNGAYLKKSFGAFIFGPD